MPLAGSFPNAADAAGYLGQLLDLPEVEPSVRRGNDRWWILADIPLNLGRELIELADGRGYLRHADQLIPDSGWGPAPQPDDQPGLALGELPEVPSLELIRAAGLHARPPAPREQAVVLAPAARALSLLRRALDLRLDAAFRPVRVIPLFEPERQLDGPHAPSSPRPGTLIEVRLQATSDARQRRHIPELLIDTLDEDLTALLCREVSARLYIQYDRHSPLTDRQLDALIQDDVWVLADPPYGCWSLSPLADYAAAGSLVRLGDSHRLGPGDESWPDHGREVALPEPTELTIAPTRDRSGPIDALLLDSDDLASLPLLLEGHPLAEFAALVPGRDRHLLVASGGITERIPLGQYLTCVGPGPIYVAHGWRTEPQLPAVVWRELAGLVPGIALVLEQSRTLAFDLSLRRPVWELWAGELPPFDPQLPPEEAQLLSRLDLQLASPPPEVSRDEHADRPADTAAPEEPPVRRGLMFRLRNRSAARGPLTWQEQATEAELAGDLIAAARLHDLHEEPELAGRLYERAAFEGSISASGVMPARRPNSNRRFRSTS